MMRALLPSPWSRRCKLLLLHLQETGRTVRQTLTSGLLLRSVPGWHPKYLRGMSSPRWQLIVRAVLMMIMLLCPHKNPRLTRWLCLLVTRWPFLLVLLAACHCLLAPRLEKMWRPRLIQKLCHQDTSSRNNKSKRRRRRRRRPFILRRELQAPTIRRIRLLPQNHQQTTLRQHRPRSLPCPPPAPTKTTHPSCLTRRALNPR
mmetsp:Transcript_4704/g.8180  ORF Transcript_4704/g.8180 Transcript_4704/m.8180 type:complete len:202 (-) Transcript_4704:1480-2085(-)